MSDTGTENSDVLWLKVFERSLVRLPVEERREIVREVQDHLQERIAQGHQTAGVLSSFGDPSDYARGFLNEYALTDAYESGKTVAMLSAVLRAARHSLTAAVGASFAFIFAVLIASSIVCLAIKTAHPQQVGLWIDRPLNVPHTYIHTGPEYLPLLLGHDHIQFGYANPTPQFPEVLGAWMYPILVFLAVLGYLGLRWSLVQSILRITGRRRSQASANTIENQS